MNFIEKRSIITTRRLTEDFYDETASIDLCRKCPNFGTRWACPPFDEPFDALRFSKVEIFLRRVKCCDGDFQKTYFSARKVFDADMLEREKSTEDSVCFYGGSCANCAVRPCPRTSGRPCEFSEKLRLSLESTGFDVSKIARELFGVDIEWQTGRNDPKIATIVAALFFD